MAFVSVPSDLVEPRLIVQFRSRDPADDTQEPLRYQLFEFAKYTVIALSHTVSTSPSPVA